MSLPPLPPIGDLPLLSWLSAIRERFNRLRADVDALNEGVSAEQLEDRLSQIEENSGILQRQRFEHYDYPNDVFDDGTSAAAPLTIATTTFTPRQSTGTQVWVTGTIAHSTGAMGPDADGAFVALFVDGVEVDRRQSFIGLNAYDLLPVMLVHEVQAANTLTIEIKCWSTATGTRFRSPGTYFIIEEVRG